MSFLCRLCGASLSRTFVDLGEMPLANAYPVSPDEKQPVYPLHVRTCDTCLLVQIHHPVPPQAIFSDYAYFSSYSSTWLEHARAFAERMTTDLGLNGKSCVIEAASNDGYLLKNFAAKGIPCLGIEPAANVAAAAIAEGIKTEVAFLDQTTAERLVAAGYKADLLIANNVIAHVPDLNGFISALSTLLHPKGVLSIEFPHVLKLIESNAFDTIYHEHFSYFSLVSLEKALRRHNLRIYAAEKLQTHGGSLRVLCVHHACTRISPASDLEIVRAEECGAGIDKASGYDGFASRVRAIQKELCDFLKIEKRKGSRIAAYGAAAKGCILLNVCGVDNGTIDFVVDRNPAKQRRFLPGSRIPIYAPEKVFDAKPDVLLILPWNIADEIEGQMQGIRAWGGRFVIAIPKLKVWNA